MAYYLIVAGGALYKMTSAGVATALTVPTDVTLHATRPARMAVLGRNVVIVNNPLRTLLVDATQTVRPLFLAPPASPVVLSAGTGTLTGTFRCKYTYRVKDPLTGALLLESPMSPVSNAVTLAAQGVTGAGLGLCPDSACTHRGLYRTADSGTEYFHWIDVDGNTVTAFMDDMADASLELFAAPEGLGQAPGGIPGTYMTLIAQWKNRLWGVGDGDVDVLRFSDDGLPYAWSADFAFNVSPVGADRYGVTGLVPRRDELGVCKRDIIWKVVGKNTDDFELLKVVEGKGCVASDSIKVIRDVGYFLGDDGVYQWGPDGVSSVSDEKVRGWFATDTYFNRAQFVNAKAKYNARYHTYELHLAAVGSSNLDRWVVYDIARKEWFGPHKRGTDYETIAGEILDTDDIAIPVVGGNDGYLRKCNQTAFNDDGTAITLALVTKSHSSDAPDVTKIFGDLSVLSKGETTKGALQIAIALGDPGSTATKTFRADLRKKRQRFSNLGPGRTVRLEFTEASVNQGCELEGYEFPFGALGRR